MNWIICLLALEREITSTCLFHLGRRLRKNSANEVGFDKHSSSETSVFSDSKCLSRCSLSLLISTEIVDPRFAVYAAIH